MTSMFKKLNTWLAYTVDYATGKDMKLIYITHTPHLTCVVFTSGQARTQLPHSLSGQVLVDFPTWAHLTCWADFLGKRWLHLTGNWFLINIAKNKSTSHDSPTGLFIHFEVQEGKNMKRQLGFLCGFFFPLHLVFLGVSLPLGFDMRILSRKLVTVWAFERWDHHA